jgi:hypothetical protein
VAGDAAGVKAEAARLAYIVDDLMDLAKADEAAPPTTETDLDEVVMEEVAAISPSTTIAVSANKVSAAQPDRRPCGVGARGPQPRRQRNAPRASPRRGLVVDVRRHDHDDGR